MTTRKKFAIFLKTISEVLENMDDDEYSKLLKGQGTLVFTKKSSKKSRAKVKEQKPIFKDVIKKLKKCDDRKHAFKLLKNIENKDTLYELAVSLEVHVEKRDKREKIEEKIVESVVGSKIRSEAIRTLNLK